AARGQGDSSKVRVLRRVRGDGPRGLPPEIRRRRRDRPRDEQGREPGHEHCKYEHTRDSSVHHPLPPTERRGHRLSAHEATSEQGCRAHCPRFNAHGGTLFKNLVERFLRFSDARVAYGSVRVPRITGTTRPATRTVFGPVASEVTETSMRLGWCTSIPCSMANHSLAGSARLNARYAPHAPAALPVAGSSAMPWSGKNPRAWRSASPSVSNAKTYAPAFGSTRLRIDPSEADTGSIARTRSRDRTATWRETMPVDTNCGRSLVAVMSLGRIPSAPASRSTFRIRRPARGVPCTITTRSTLPSRTSSSRGSTPIATSCWALTIPSECRKIPSMYATYAV